MSVGIVYGTFWFFEGQQQAADAAAQKYPLAVGQSKQPPAPNLQTQPFKDIYMLRQAEATRLGSYGWVDKEGGIVRMPIDRAMEADAAARLSGAAGRRRRAERRDAGQFVGADDGASLNLLIDDGDLVIW